MDLKRCKAFVSAVEYGTMSTAAKRLGYTTSGVIRLINALEDELGFPVLDRTSTGVSPTPEGRRMLPIFKEMIRLEEQAERTGDRIRGLSEGTLTIGALSTLASFWLPRVLQDFQTLYPNVHVDIVGGSNATLFEKLDNFHVDCCLCHKGSDRFDWIPLGRQEVLVWTQRNHPLVKHGEILMAELDGKPFIMTNPDDDSLFDDMMYRNKIEPDIRFTTSGWHATYSLVDAGLGMSICANGIAERWKSDNVVGLSLSPKKYLEYGIATFPGSTPSPALERFIAIAKKYENRWPLV